MGNLFIREEFIKSIDEVFSLDIVECLPPSTLVRNDEHLFTFSPILDLENRFIEGSDFFKNQKRLAFKIQECFRDVYPQNLFNPLAKPYQFLYSFYAFRRDNYLRKITSFSYEFFLNRLGLSFDKLFFIAPEIDFLLENLDEKVKDKTIFINKQRLRCKIPTIKGEHYYFKVLYSKNNGLITLANFVLIDLKNEDGNISFKLDSAFFEERIHLVISDIDFIYQDKRYYADLLNEFEENLGLTHFFLSNLEAIQRLSQELDVSHKRQGYQLKKLINDIFHSLYYFDKKIPYGKLTFLNLNTVELLKEREKVFKDILKSLKSADKFLKKSALNSDNCDDLLSEIRGRYGLSKLVLYKTFKYLNEVKAWSLDEENKTFYAYEFDFKKNKYFSPLRDYK